MAQSLQHIRILGVPILKARRADAISAIERLVDAEAPVLVAYVNAHTLNFAHSDAAYRSLLQGASLVLNDGSGVGLAARMNGDAFPENLNGSDFNPLILELAARRRWPVYFLGASPGVAEAAARRLQAQIPDLTVAGTRDGFFPRSDDVSVAQAIKGTGAEVLMVAMGNPLQEFWLRDHLADTGASLGVGVGAFFDFSAENVKRAPAWMNRAGIEWVFRLLQEPQRLWKRYVVGNPVFLVRVLRQRLTRR